MYPTHPDDHADRLAYSIKDASRVNSIGKTRLYALINSGQLKMIKVGKRTLVSGVSLRKLIEEGG